MACRAARLAKRDVFCIRHCILVAFAIVVLPIHAVRDTMALASFVASGGSQVDDTAALSRSGGAGAASNASITSNDSTPSNVPSLGVSKHVEAVSVDKPPKALCCWKENEKASVQHSSMKGHTMTVYDVAWQYFADGSPLIKCRGRWNGFVGGVLGLHEEACENPEAASGAAVLYRSSEDIDLLSPPHSGCCPSVDGVFDVGQPAVGAKCCFCNMRVSATYAGSGTCHCKHGVHSEEPAVPSSSCWHNFCRKSSATRQC